MKEVILCDICPEDAGLYAEMFCDPDYMKELGGAHSREKALEVLNRQINCNATGSGLVRKIVDPTTKEAVGTVCVWNGFYKDAPLVEMGWGVAVKYQGRGYGTAGVSKMLELALFESPAGKWGDSIHAFTAETNLPSNAMCKKVGFELLEETEIDYDGKMIHANHWVFSRRPTLS